MKVIKVIFIFTLLLSLTACGTRRELREPGDPDGYSFPDGVVNNPEGIEILKNDNTVTSFMVHETVFDTGEPISKYLDAGWQLSAGALSHYGITTDEIDGFMLKSHTYLNLELDVKNDINGLKIQIVNDTDKAIKLKDAKLGSIEATTMFSGKFFMKGGIVVGATDLQIQNKLNELNINYTIDSESEYIITDKDENKRFVITFDLPREDDPEDVLPRAKSFKSINTELAQSSIFSEYVIDDQEFTKKEYLKELSEYDTIEVTIDDIYEINKPLSASLMTDYTYVVYTADGVRYAVDMSEKFLPEDRAGYAKGTTLIIYYNASYNEKIKDIDSQEITRIRDVRAIILEDGTIFPALES